MPAAAGITVHGLRDLNRAVSKASKDARREVRAAERQIAEPVRAEAQELAAREISHIGREWHQMRVGTTQKLIYVAPKMRNRGGAKRKNLAGLLMDKAMQPALDHNQHRLEREVDQALDKIANTFNRGT